MSKQFKEPYIQCCPKCGWISEVLITGDLLFAVNCAICESSLKLKPFSSLPLLTRIKLRLTLFRGQFTHYYH